MAPKKYFKKRSEKRKYRRTALARVKRPRFASSYSPSYNAVYPLPAQLRTRMRYFSTNHAVNPGIGGTAAEHVFSLNGLYDPDITGVGHQPVGFDQLSEIYDHYTVLGAKATVSFFSTDTTNDMIVAAYIMDTTTAAVDIRVPIENGKAKWRHLSSLSNGGRTTAVMTLPVSLSRFLGVSNPLDETALRGNSSGNPAEQAYLHIAAAPNNSNDAANVTFTVAIEYYVVWTEPKQLDLS